MIDDDPRFRDLVGVVFSPEFEVASAKDWAEGLQACRQAPVDVVMLDLCMPRVNGLAVARALCCDATTRDIPVVVMSSSRPDGFMRKALAAQKNIRGTVDKLAGVRALRAALAAATQAAGAHMQRERI